MCFDAAVPRADPFPSFPPCLAPDHHRGGALRGDVAFTDGASGSFPAGYLDAHNCDAEALGRWRTAHPSRRVVRKPHRGHGPAVRDPRGMVFVSIVACQPSATISVYFFWRTILLVGSRFLLINGLLVGRGGLF